MTRLNVVLTSHNRRERTARSIRSVFAQVVDIPIRLDVILVDDGSTDGTKQRIRKEFPQVTVLSGDGSLFWSGGMRRAFAAALEQQPDYVLWLNDDTNLYRDAINRLLET